MVRVTGPIDQHLGRASEAFPFRRSGNESVRAWRLVYHLPKKRVNEFLYDEFAIGLVFENEFRGLPGGASFVQ